MRTQETALFSTMPFYGAVFLVFAFLAYSTDALALSNQIVLLLVAVFFFGMPHGALDILMLKDLANRKKVSLMIIAGLYTTVAGFAFSAWLMLPTLCLVIFLFLSSRHFASDWNDVLPGICAQSVGVLVVTLPSVMYGPQTVILFEMLMLTKNASHSVVTLMQLACVISVISLLVFGAIHRLSGLSLLYITLIVLSGLLLTPLLFFLVYFCVLHSSVHTLAVKNKTNTNWRFLAATAMMPLMGTCVLILGMYALLPQANDSTQLVRLVFISLFALTIPHILLTQIYDAYAGSVHAKSA